ncbi:MAG TPA: hypothetical protein VFE30_14755 [Anaeromyxobacteraceae bacterium]|jgi:hypothetical protein|nr:hypothetical protein [Anaeromyxobacteraceae bacterium]
MAASPLPEVLSAIERDSTYKMLAELLREAGLLWAVFGTLDKVSCTALFLIAVGVAMMALGIILERTRKE